MQRMTVSFSLSTILIGWSVISHDPNAGKLMKRIGAIPKTIEARQAVNSNRAYAESSCQPAFRQAGSHVFCPCDWLINH